MIGYLKHELKHLPFILILFAVLYVIVRFFANNVFQPKRINPNNAIDLGDAVSSGYACVSGYSTYNTRLSSIESTVGNSQLTTNASTVIGAINELDGKFNRSGVLGISAGGTGGTTVADIKEALEIPDASEFPTRSALFSITTTDTNNGISASLTRYGNLVMLYFDGTLTSALAKNTAFLTLPDKYKCGSDMYFPVFSNQNGANYYNVVRGRNNNGVLSVAVAIDSGKILRGTMVCVIKAKRLYNFTGPNS